MLPGFDSVTAQSDEYIDWQECFDDTNDSFYCDGLFPPPPTNTPTPVPPDTPTPVPPDTPTPVPPDTPTPVPPDTPTPVPPDTPTPVPPDTPTPPPEEDYANWQECFDDTNDSFYCDGLFPPPPTNTPTPVPPDTPTPPPEEDYANWQECFDDTNDSFYCDGLFPPPPTNTPTPVPPDTPTPVPPDTPTPVPPDTPTPIPPDTPTPVPPDTPTPVPPDTPTPIPPDTPTPIPPDTPTPIPPDTPTPVPPDTPTPVPPDTPTPPPEEDYANWQECFDDTNDSFYCDGLFPPPPTNTPTPVPPDTPTPMPPLPKVGTPSVTGTVVLESISVTWDDPPVEGASHYLIQNSVDNGPWYDLMETTDTNFPHNWLYQRTQYNFRIKAHGDGVTRATGWGDWSSTYSATPGPPPAPSGFTIDSKTSSSATISFTMPSDVSKYQVRRKVSDQGGWVLQPSVTGTPGTKNTYEVTGMITGYSYDLALQFFGDGVRYSDLGSGWTSSQSVAILPVPGTPDLTASPDLVSTKKINLEWTAMTGVSHFQVDRQREGGEWGYVYKHVNGTWTGVTVTGYCGTLYTFRVYAYGDGKTKAATWGAPAEKSARTNSCVSSNSNSQTKHSKLVPCLGVFDKYKK